jgi:hypothetical protein
MRQTGGRVTDERMKHQTHHVDHERPNCGLLKEPKRAMNEATSPNAADIKQDEDVFVLRIAPARWNVCRWNADRRHADGAFYNSEEAAKVHACRWAGVGNGQAWLVRADGSMASIELQDAATPAWCEGDSDRPSSPARAPRSVA